MPALARDLDLRASLRAAARDGAAHVPRALDDGFGRRLRREIDAGPFAPFEEEFGPVRQQIDGYDIRAPMDAFPLTRQLCEHLRVLVRSHGGGVRGLASWKPNEVGVAHYLPGSIGITPHLDGKWYRRLVAVVTLYGAARFAVCGSRDPGDVVVDWRVRPGDLVLM
ncbi:MAG TPA: hypothetical protein VJN50_05540, partial [Actinomycetota bacterium]|nr:hypothetical protein [Actinomycetota bacterium]